MSSTVTIKSIEAELDKAREVYKKAASTAELKSGFATSMRFYHNSKTRHHAIMFTLENGETVHKDLRDNALDVLKSFRDCKKVALWYDESKTVQQYVLSYDF